MAYDQAAIDFVFGFYARGWSKERSLPEIRKVYPGISGSTWDEWVKKYDWPARRARSDAKRAQFEEMARNAGATLLIELTDVKDRLLKEIRDGKLDTQTVYAYTSTTRQIDEIARRHLAAQGDPQRVAVEVLAGAFERLIVKLRALNGLKKPLEAHAKEIGAVVTEVVEEFGREARG